MKQAVQSVLCWGEGGDQQKIHDGQPVTAITKKRTLGLSAMTINEQLFFAYQTSGHVLITTCNICSNKLCFPCTFACHQCHVDWSVGGRQWSMTAALAMPTGMAQCGTTGQHQHVANSSVCTGCTWPDATTFAWLSMVGWPHSGGSRND
jgi:hypothetical protein